MRPSRYGGDAGQAFPIYIMVVAGLLFLAFAYLAVGQAAANRNGAQTAADAAALAAAQETRDQLAGMWVEDVLDPTKWQDIFDGIGVGSDGCWRAYELAAQNDADVRGCDPVEPLGYTVAVESTKPVGDSIVPGTEDMKSQASATAVIEPRCTFELPGEDAGGEAEPGDGNDVLPLPQLTCEDRNWDPDPEDPTTLPDPEDLFDVHLADSAAIDE
ncbi:pilus assembly protein TadG-related protein [Streptomyces sp. DT2A-34]|uniref:pilus assembly protein TadG-related protein n=1 Tax=Streptomyces sp. DT2A-34 TaxID=3051182 RepID=UPI00265C2DA9|nr:pilus assembly protein TadG-related protein [Streptomyces sp. DT2A-34]MDO0912130.1 pilus assembly protein TadG-related protein [Streptomyces sp. DT2A-34]